MDGFVEVGSTAMRDPVTGDFLPAVPLYIRAEDREKCRTPVIDGGELMKALAGKIGAYKKAKKKAKKEAC